MMNYYNDNDKFSVKWLNALIESKQIPEGRVDAESISDIKPSDLEGFIQCHFFAGIGGWPYALDLAGWPRDREVWTGSCPCQPFSVAGKGAGLDDDRHLWPAFRWLIAQRRPAVIFGEQVASKDGREWLSGVRSDLEVLGYEVGASDLCSAGVGSPNIRQRLFWVAHTTSPRPVTSQQKPEVEARNETWMRGFESGCSDGWMADAECRGREGRDRSQCERLRNATERCHDYDGWMGNARSEKSGGIPNIWWEKMATTWRASKTIECRDGKLRRIPVESALFPLAPRIPGRVGLLRGAGNAINPWVAAEFIKAFIETEV